ncbi:phosphopantetheine-binding protein [Patulibacter americanus]|uniref:phosphopantetheine-binding protein n=1 Tax=Patulibacter americanus TaxID=588672 RepID=UPI0003B767A3|nr:phosphopantetheine-binding protein [Patulibacter americanus]
MTPAETSPVPRTIEELRRTVGGLVGEDPDAISDDDDLVLDWALDSVRAMTFVGGLRKAGVEVTLLELTEAPTLSAWWALISARADGAR